MVKNYLQFEGTDSFIAGPFISNADGVTRLDQIADFAAADVKLKKANADILTSINTPPEGPWYVSLGLGYYLFDIQDSDTDVLGSLDILINYADALPVKKLCEVKRYHALNKTGGTNGTTTLSPATDVFDGENVLVTMTPDQGYVIDDLTVNGVDKTSEVVMVQSVGYYGIQNVAGPVEVSTGYAAAP